MPPVPKDEHTYGLDTTLGRDTVKGYLMGQQTLCHKSRVTSVAQVIPWVWALLLVLWGLPICETLSPTARGKRGEAHPPSQHVPGTALPYQKSWAVVVGIDDYRHPAIPSLRYAIIEKFADSNNDKVITTTELFVFVEERVRRDSGGKQNPQYGKLLGEGQFLFLSPGFDRPAGSAEFPSTSVSVPHTPIPPSTPLPSPVLRPAAYPTLNCNDLRLKMSLGVDPLDPKEQQFLQNQCRR